MRRFFDDALWEKRCPVPGTRPISALFPAAGHGPLLIRKCPESEGAGHRPGPMEAFRRAAVHLTWWLQYRYAPSAAADSVTASAMAVSSSLAFPGASEKVPG